MIRAVIEHALDDGSIVMSTIEINVRRHVDVTYCSARIEAPDGHRPMLREVEICGVPDGAGAVWIVGEVIRRALAFAEETPEREY
jgi:hypothetical protein